MAELALDQRQRDALVQQLDGVRVAKLVRRHPPAHSCFEREVVQLDPHRAGRPGTAAGRTVDHAEQRSDRQLHAVETATTREMSS